MSTKIAFLVLAHTDPIHLSRLCRTLGTDNDVFIHLDSKTPSSFFENLKTAGNVNFTRRRVPVHWADISVVEATLILIEEALNTGNEYLRLVLLSGACHPVKPVDALQRFFLQHPHFNNIKYINLLEPVAETIRLSNFHFKKPLVPVLDEASIGNYILANADRAARKMAHYLLRFIDRGFRQQFPEITPYFGSQWWAITLECAKMVVRFVKSRPDFVEYHKYSFAPDEMFFHTIIGNSEFANKADGVIPYTERFDSLGNLHIIHGSLKKIFTFDDLDHIRRSTKFFVRKVSTGESDQLLDYLDRIVLAKGG